MATPCKLAPSDNPTTAWAKLRTWAVHHRDTHKSRSVIAQASALCATLDVYIQHRDNTAMATSLWQSAVRLACQLGKLILAKAHKKKIKPRGTQS
jgi:hypothetical protein